MVNSRSDTIEIILKNYLYSLPYQIYLLKEQSLCVEQ